MAAASGKIGRVVAIDFISVLAIDIAAVALAIFSTYCFSNFVIPAARMNYKQLGFACSAESASLLKNLIFD
jgi:hypothetical protein